jgi:hypothetical protein
MATYIGKDGTISAGGNDIAEVRSFSIEATGDTTEDTSMGDTWRTHKPTLRSWSGSAEVWWDDADTGQNACSVGAELAIIVTPDGDDGGTPTTLSGNVIVTGRTVNASVDGMVEASLTFMGNGALTEGS